MSVGYTSEEAAHLAGNQFVRRLGDGVEAATEPRDGRVVEAASAPEWRTCPSLGLQNKANKSFVFIDCIAAFGKTDATNTASIDQRRTFSRSGQIFVGRSYRNEANKYPVFKQMICA
jgi:hypothetical protein